VPPAELEALLREYPGVADAAVTGVIVEDDSDERPFALVVRNVSAGPGPSEEGLLRYVADRTADYKHLVGVAFVDGVPRSDAGKIMRRQLNGLLPADRTPSRASA
jgi:4-coumarate--CoA ligase